MATSAPPRTEIILADPRRVEQRLTDAGNLAKLEPLLASQSITPERFVRVVVQALARNEKLRQSTEESVVLAVMEAAQLGLEPTGVLGMAYLVPYWNKHLRAYEAKLMVGYRGFVDLMRRSGELRTIEARVVYEGDEFEAAYGLPQTLRHVPASVVGAAQGDRRFVYWLARLSNGEAQFDILEMAEIEKARKSSRAADDGPWVNWYDRMSCKTAVRRSVATLPLSIVEARHAVWIEDEAESSADRPPAATRAELSTREKAVALIAGEANGDGEAAPEDAGGAEAAPEEGTPDSSTEAETAGSVDPDASEAPETGEQETLLDQVVGAEQETLLGEADSEEGLPE